MSAICIKRMHHRRRSDLEHRRRLRFRREQPLSRLFPNLITMAGLCCGLSSVRFALLGKWEFAVAAILAAAIIDGMDGRVARLLGATSVFGAQLDSLSDFVCFGVAPALVLYIWQLHDISGIGWALVLFYTMCCGLRLARFNTALGDETPPEWQKQFFTGVPSPAGALLCLLPLMFYIQLGEDVRIPPFLLAAHVVLMGVLMASRIPTFAAKNLRIAPEYILPITLVFAAVVGLFIAEPWWMLILLSVVYFAVIPVAYLRYKKLSQNEASSPKSSE